VPGAGDKLQRVYDFINTDDWSTLNYANEISEIVTNIVDS